MGGSKASVPKHGCGALARLRPQCLRPQRLHRQRLHPQRPGPRALFALLAGALIGAPAQVRADPPSIAFFYGRDPPVAELSAFDRVVVEPDHLSRAEVAAFRQRGVELYAYLSVGEADRSRRWFGQLRREWFLGENPAWGTVVLDPAAPGWRRFLLARIGELRRDGYDGVFLDTLDSHELAVSDESRRQRHWDALASLVREAHARHRRFRFLFNRGFQVLDRAPGVVDGMVAESLFRAWDPAGGGYREVSEGDRAWLAAKLGEVQRRHGIPAYAVDYVPPGRRDLARETARRISELGFVPYVAQPAFDAVGIGAVEVVPRKVLLLYDGERHPRLRDAPVHRFAAVPLEHLGLVPTYVDVRRGVPEGDLHAAYAGAVAWFDDALPPSVGFREWLLRCVEERFPVAVVGGTGAAFDDAALARLGIARERAELRQPIALAGRDRLVGFEAEPRARTRGLVPWRLAGEGRAHLALSDDGGRALHPVATTEWGGWAFHPYVLEERGDGAVRWIVEPFEFFRAALRLERRPVPDVTTESGRRILTVLAEGDGLGERALQRGAPWAADVLRTAVLDRFGFPTTVSVIASDLSPSDPAEAAGVLAAARRLVAHARVEVAAHTMTHPLQWDVPGVELSREVEASVRVVERALGTRVAGFSWPGSADVPPAALEAAAALSLWSVGSGSVQGFSSGASVAAIPPLVLPAGPHRLHWTPLVGEGGPVAEIAAGLRQGRELFAATGSPRRLRPFAVYFHLRDASRPATLDPLVALLEWARGQKPHPLPLSAYLRKTEAFHDVVLARRLDGGWVVAGDGNLATLRLDPEQGWPDLGRSRGIAGVADAPEGRFVTLAARRAVLHLAPECPSTPHLVSANGRVLRWEPRPGGAQVRIRGHVPVELEIAAPGVRRCRLEGRELRLSGTRQGDTFLFRQKGSDTGDVELRCE